MPLTACVKQTELERPPVRSQKVKLPQGTWLPGIAHAAICKALPVFLLQSVLESPLPRASNLILAEARLAAQHWKDPPWPSGPQRRWLAADWGRGSLYPANCPLVSRTKECRFPPRFSQGPFELGGEWPALQLL